jgi:capsular polysaccharide biosynthesis protein
METRDFELIDYLRILWKRRWLVGCGTIAVVVAVGGLSLVVSRAYETTLELKIGKVWDKPIENPYQLALLTNSESFLKRVREVAALDLTVSQMRRTKVLLAEVVESREAEKEGLLLSLTARGRTPDEALKVAQKAVALIIEDHKSVFEEMMKQNLLYEKQLETQIAAVRAGIDNVSALLGRHQRTSQVDAPAVILLQAQLEAKEVELLSFMREVWDVRTKNISTIHTDETRVAFPPVRPEKATKPKIALNVVLAGLFGLITMSLLGFFVDRLERTHLSERTPAVGV